MFRMRDWPDFTILLWIVTAYNAHCHSSCSCRCHNNHIRICVNTQAMRPIGREDLQCIVHKQLQCLDMFSQMHMNWCVTDEVFTSWIFLPATQCSRSTMHSKQQKFILIFFLSNNRPDRLSIGGVGVNIFWDILLPSYHNMFRHIRRP